MPQNFKLFTIVLVAALFVATGVDAWRFRWRWRRAFTAVKTVALASAVVGKRSTDEVIVFNEN